MKYQYGKISATVFHHGEKVCKYFREKFLPYFRLLLSIKTTSMVETLQIVKHEGNLSFRSHTLLYSIETI